MITIIFDGPAGELRMDEKALRYLESNEIVYIRELCSKLKERITNDTSNRTRED